MVTGAPVAQFTLADHRGRERAASDFAGSFLLVYFGFTHCKVVCPRSVAKLSRVLDALGAAAHRVVPLYITVDPERDTPERLAAYVEANCPRFTGLTGTREQVDAAKKAFRVFAERKTGTENGDDYDVPHTAIAYLMAPDGSYLDHFIEATDEQVVVDRIAKALSKS